MCKDLKEFLEKYSLTKKNNNAEKLKQLKPNPCPIKEWESQVFVVEGDEFQTIKTSDTVVVTIGVNYGEKKARKDLYDIDQKVRNNLKQLLKKENFHLIMTNLSPWLSEPWSEWGDSCDFRFRKEFLNQAKEFGYIKQLQLQLESYKNVIWVGHTKDIWTELDYFMSNELKLKEYYLAYNLSYTREKWQKGKEYVLVKN